jgi:hypothetical protein
LSGDEPHEEKLDGETDRPILDELAFAMRMIPAVAGLQVKESLWLP